MQEFYVLRYSAKKLGSKHIWNGGELDKELNGIGTDMVCQTSIADCADLLRTRFKHTEEVGTLKNKGKS